jgi:hypothetical protein
LDIASQLGPYKEFRRKLAYAMRLPALGRAILDHFNTGDAESAGLARLIEGSPLVRDWFLWEAKGLGLAGRAQPTLQTGVLLVGMEGTRDFVLGILLLESIAGRVPVARDGKLEPAPGSLAAFARRAEQAARDGELGRPEWAYSAGLMFDIAALVARERFGSPKGFAEYAEEVFAGGLASAAASLELPGGGSPELFAACVARDIGKLALELIHPGAYADFRRELGARPGGFTRGQRNFLEARRFGLSHDSYGAQLFHHFHPLRKLERSILFHHEPYLLAPGDPALAFARAIAAASAPVQLSKD